MKKCQLTETVYNEEVENQIGTSTRDYCQKENYTYS